MKLGIIRPHIPKKKKYPEGIRADGPNQIWHADITIVKTKDNKKHYVYLLMDNYSKYILSWRIEPFVSGKVRAETIKEAYKKHITRSQNVTLIIDGGPENINKEMDSFMNSHGISLRRLVALKDVPYSNSVIEAQNRLFKYGYLFRQDYDDIHNLRKVFGWDIHDFNDVRPHISNKGLTPLEAYNGLERIRGIWTEQIDEAQKSRLLINKNELCGICEKHTILLE